MRKTTNMGVLKGVGAVVAIGLCALSPRSADPALAMQRFPAQMRLSGFVGSVSHDVKGNWYVVEWTGSRVVVLSPTGKFVRQIGGPGSGPEDLMNPGSIAVAKDGTIAVRDIGNSRVQFFSPEGKNVGQFAHPSSRTAVFTRIAFDDDSALFVNEPASGKLVSVYSREGKMLRQFGELIPSTVGYPGKPSRRFPRELLNLADIHVERNGAILVVFRFMPIVRRYSRSGVLDKEIRLTDPSVESSVRTFWGEPGARASAAGIGFDGKLVSYVIGASEVTSRGNLVLALQERCIIVLDNSGKQTKKLSVGPNPATVLCESENRLVVGFQLSLSRTVSEIDF